MDYKSKKVAIISVLSTLLVVGAIAGTVAFIKGNNQSGAAENVIANETTNIVVENVIDGDTNTNTNTNSVVPSDGGNAGGDGGNIAPVAPDNTPTTDENGNEVIIDVDGNSHVIGPVTNDDGSTTTTEGDGIGGYIQRTVIPEHMIWEWTIVDWTEILPKTIAANIEIPSVEGEKYYTVDGSDTDTAAVVGQNVTYYIDVINIGDTTLEQFRVVDAVPTGTELVDGTISDEGDLDEYGRVIWKLDLEPEETKTVSFTVTVTSNEVNPIVNKAKVNGEGTNETKTPIIETSKKAFVVEEDGTLSTRDAKVGETIRYVISLTNNSEEEGTTTVFDTVPENTEFVSADERFTVSEDKSSLEATISVPAGETIELTFDVEVYDDEEDEEITKSVRNIAIIGGIPTPPVETKVANIKTVKTATPDEPLHELGKIHYELVSTNSGDGKGTVTITDTVPAGTELVPNSITNGGTMGEDGVITWTVTLEPGKSATSAFDVIVLPFSNEEGKLTVRNATAKQDGKEIPPTETEATKEYKSVSVNKDFDDNENEDEKRPTEVTVRLFNEKTNATVSQVELNDGNNWVYTFNNLDKYNSEKEEIQYKVEEINIDEDYTATVTPIEDISEKDKYAFEITNTLKYDTIKTEIPVEKEWEDNPDIETARKTVVFNLYVKNGDNDEGTLVASANITEENEWKHTFRDVSKYDSQGNELSYYVEEAEVPEHYTMERVSDTIIKNKIDYTTFTTSKSVEKKWVDVAGTTHKSITLRLYADGEATDKTHDLNNGETTYTFENLPKYKVNGTEVTEIRYTVKEDNGEGNENYDVSYNPVNGGTDIITNTIKQGEIEIVITKIWVDPDVEGQKHKDIRVKVYDINDPEDYIIVIIEGQVADSYTSDAIKLPKYKKKDGQYVLDANGNVQEVTYAIEEETNGWNDYRASYPENEPYTIKNTIIQENTEIIAGKKIWKDEAETHPTIKVYLTKKVGNSYVRVKDDNGNDVYYELSNGNVDYEFKDLPKYDENGQYIKYGVEEERVEGYCEPSNNGNDIINLIEPGETSVPVEKTWIRPDENYEDVTIRLYQGDTEVNSVTFKKSNYTNGKATYTFTTLRDGSPLPMYDNNGHKYVYTTREDAITGYHQKSDTPENEYVNVIDAGEQDITVAKVWEAPEGDIPAVQVALTIDGVQQEPVTLTYPDNPSHKFENLPIYNTETGKKIVYSVDEINVPEGYSKNVAVSEDGLNYTITNTINQKYVTVDVTKTWIDPTNEEHPDVKFILKQNGVQYPDANTYYTLTGGYTDDQKALDTITNLPRYKMADGKYVKDENGRVVENVYTVEEVKVAGYDMIPEEGPEGHKTDAGNWEYAVTNRITQTKTSINVRKLWSIPEGVTVTKPDIRIRLYRSTNKTDPVDTGKSEVIESDGDGTCIFSDLEVYDLVETSEGYGERYIYTVTEEDAVTGKPVRNFVPSIVENADGSGYTITNTFDQEIKGTVTFTQTTHGEADVKVPMDVVFILDASGSMDEDGNGVTEQRGNKMVSAVNQTINYLMENNVENRIAVVTYNGSKSNDNHNDTKVLLPLGTYKSIYGSGNFLKIDEKSNRINNHNDEIYTTVYAGTVQTNSDGVKEIVPETTQYPSIRETLSGATYTQMGIAVGANQLINAPNKVIKETIDGFEYTYTRTPIIILLSDGGPTVYSASEAVTSTSHKDGAGSRTGENEAYWTIKSAKYYKNLVTNAYYPEGDKTAKFFTVGYGVSNTAGVDQKEKVVLNPTRANILDLYNYRNYGTSVYSGYSYEDIYNKLHNNDSTLNSYSYSDRYQGTSFNTQELRDFLTQSLSEDHTITPTRPITLAESDAMRVYMPDIDRSKEFSIKIDGTTVTTSTSYERVKLDTTTGEYYVDLTDLPKGTTIDIFYTKVTQTAGE